MDVKALSSEEINSFNKLIDLKILDQFFGFIVVSTVTKHKLLTQVMLSMLSIYMFVALYGQYHHEAGMLATLGNIPFLSWLMWIILPISLVYTVGVLHREISYIECDKIKMITNDLELKLIHEMSKQSEKVKAYTDQVHKQGRALMTIDLDMVKSIDAELYKTVSDSVFFNKSHIVYE